MLSFNPLPKSWGEAALIMAITMAASASAQSTLIPDELKSQYAEQVFIDADSVEHRYRLLLPAGFKDGEAKKYPLVLLLHGAGERGDDNALQLKHGAAEFVRADRQMDYPCIVIVPQCPKDAKWVDVDWSPGSGTSTFPNDPSPSMKMALRIVDQWIAGGRVDPSRVYLTGISMGGYGCWFASAVNGNPFAATIPICGGGDPSWADRYGKTPIWTFHGTDDTAVPIGRSREMIQALKKIGHRPEPKYTEYEGGAHDVWTQTYKRDDVFEWLFSQRK